MWSGITDKCAYSVIQLHPRVCDSVFVSAHGLKCLLGVFITFSDLQRDSYFTSHLGQGRAGWQSAGPPGRGGASDKPTRSQAGHSCISNLTWRVKGGIITGGSL